jgi:tRNA U34 5-methylaminomethyl-2-thiouridine-forming methyltransferase MnmC
MKYHILISESFGITYEVEADSIKEAHKKFDQGSEWKEVDRESVDWMHVSTEEVDDGKDN